MSELTEPYTPTAPEGASVCLLCSVFVDSSTSGRSTIRWLLRLSASSRRLQALDTIEDFLKGAYGADALERIDGGTHAAQRHAAVQRFNQPDSPAW